MREIYKKLMKKVEDVLDPKPAKKKEKSLYMMMNSGKGTSLDVTKQVNQVGLRAKRCKDIPDSISTTKEKFVFENKLYENQEQ